MRNPIRVLAIVGVCCLLGALAYYMVRRAGATDLEGEWTEVGTEVSGLTIPHRVQPGQEAPYIIIKGDEMYAPGFEEKKKFKLFDGLAIDLIAAEPVVRQPLSPWTREISPS